MIIFVDKFRRKPENRTTIRTPGIDRICVCAHYIIRLNDALATIRRVREEALSGMALPGLFGQ